MERGNSGCYCAIHHAAPCSSVISVGDVIILEKVQLNDGEDAMKAMMIVDGHPTCYAAFLPRSLLKYFNLLHQIMGKYTVVKELCTNSQSAYKQFLDYQNCGQVLVEIVPAP